MGGSPFDEGASGVASASVTGEGTSGAPGTVSSAAADDGGTSAADADVEGGSGGDEGSTGAPDVSPSHGDPVAGFPEIVALLDEIEGWGTGTTGGLDGTIFVVDTLDDDGPRSLRAALQSDEAHWILFADGLDGTIELAETIDVGSDKTVDARGHAIHIRSSPQDPFTALKMVGQSNVVLANLRLDDELEAWDQDAEGADALQIHDSHHVWVHHCTFERWLDGAIDIKLDGGERTHHVSITWSRFSRVFQALNWTADRISFGHNVCDPVRRRCIQMIDGRGHSYNNVVADWDEPAIQNAKDGAELWSQRNMFVPGGPASVNSRVNGGKIRNTDPHTFGAVQFVGGNDDLDPQFMDESAMLAKLDVCDDDACWAELRATIEAGAGVQ